MTTEFVTTMTTEDPVDGERTEVMCLYQSAEQCLEKKLTKILGKKGKYVYRPLRSGKTRVSVNGVSIGDFTGDVSEYRKEVIRITTQLKKAGRL